MQKKFIYLMVIVLLLALIGVYAAQPALVRSHSMPVMRRTHFAVPIRPYRSYLAGDLPALPFQPPARLTAGALRLHEQIGGGALGAVQPLPVGARRIPGWEQVEPPEFAAIGRAGVGIKRFVVDKGGIGGWRVGNPYRRLDPGQYNTIFDLLPDSGANRPGILRRGDEIVQINRPEYVALEKDKLAVLPGGLFGHGVAEVESVYPSSISSRSVSPVPSLGVLQQVSFSEPPPPIRQASSLEPEPGPVSPDPLGLVATPSWVRGIDVRKKIVNPVKFLGVMKGQRGHSLTQQEVLEFPIFRPAR